VVRNDLQGRPGYFIGPINRDGNKEGAGRGYEVCGNPLDMGGRRDGGKGRVF